jgi:hypothetical protein
MPCANERQARTALASPVGGAETPVSQHRPRGVVQREQMSTFRNPTAAGRPANKSDVDIAGRQEIHLPGPVPLPWLAAAARLPGKSLHVAVALWCLSRLTHTQCVQLTNVCSSHFGLDRCSKYRAIRWLEQAGLITVDRHVGRAPIVTIRTACDV